MLTLLLVTFGPFVLLYLFPRKGITSAWYRQYECPECGHRSRYSHQVSSPCHRCGWSGYGYKTRVVRQHHPNALFWFFNRGGRTETRK